MLRFLLPVALALLLPSSGRAQSVDVRAAAAVGAEGLGQTMHLYYGGEVGASYGPASLTAVGFLGRGNDFSSRLVAVTPGFRAWSRGGGDLFVTAGLGRYRETLESGPTRSTGVLAGGVSGRVPVGPLRVAVILVGFRGSLGPGGGGGGALPVSGVRFAVGLGL